MACREKEFKIGKAASEWQKTNNDQVVHGCGPKVEGVVAEELALPGIPPWEAAYGWEVSTGSKVAAVAEEAPSTTVGISLFARHNLGETGRGNP